MVEFVGELKMRTASMHPNLTKHQDWKV